MLKMLQTGFGGYVGTETLEDLRTIGVGGVRLKVQGFTPEEACSIAAESQAVFGVNRVLITAFNVNEIVALPAGSLVECGNEPDLGFDYPDHQRVPPETYAVTANMMMEVCRRSGFTLWGPAVSNLNRRGIEYLREVMPMLPEDMCVTIHRYPNDTLFSSGPEVPHDGFSSREEEIETLRSIIGNYRLWGVSEFGYHTAPRAKRVGGKVLFSRRWTDEQNGHENVPWEWNFWSEQGATFAVLFQLNDGPEGSADVSENSYGIRRYDLSWKPTAATFAETTSS